MPYLYLSEKLRKLSSIKTYIENKDSRDCGRLLNFGLVLLFEGHLRLLRMLTCLPSKNLSTYEC